MKCFKRSCNLPFCFITFLLLTIFFINGCSNKNTNVINIGVILPLTGNGAELGEGAKLGIDLAIKEINRFDFYSGKNIIAIYEDSEGDPTKAVSAATKLIKSDNVKILIGPLFSSTTLAVAPIAEKNKVILISPGASNPKITNAGEYIFRNYPSDSYEGKLSADYIYDSLKINNVGIIWVNNDYGVGLKEVFINEYTKLGGSVIFFESYNQGEIDFRSILIKSKNKNINTIYIPGYYEDIGRLILQSVELGLKFQFFSNIGVEHEKLFEIGGNSVDGLLYTAPTFDINSNNTLIVNFVQNFNNEYNKTPGFPAVYSYDTMYIIFESLKNLSNYNKINTVEIQGNLLKISKFSGVTGLTTIDRNGDVIKEFLIKVVDNGEFAPYIR